MNGQNQDFNPGLSEWTPGHGVSTGHVLQQLSYFCLPGFPLSLDPVSKSIFFNLQINLLFKVTTKYF